jgi:hypothetical protein
MINHISIGVNNTEKVANILAELWDGYALPFPPAPDSYMVFADDGRGTAVEVTPINTILVRAKVCLRKKVLMKRHRPKNTKPSL